MREDILTTEDLARALAEYLRAEQQKKDAYLLKEIKNINKDYLILNNEYNLIKFKEKPLKKIYDFDNINDELSEEELIREILKRRELGSERTKTLSKSSPMEQENERNKFIQDPSRTLDIHSSSYLKRDEGVILESIRRDIRSIVYAYSTSENIKEQAIIEAKRQGYTFQADTPIYMLQNAELIKLSAQRDINSIHFVPDNVWTNELATFVYQIALQNGYTLCQSSPRFFKNNIQIIKQSLKLDVNSNIHVAWNKLTPEDLIALENYIVENNYDFVINYRTPINFRRNVEICIKSIKNETSNDSIVYIDWEYIDKHNPDGIKRLLNTLIEQKFVLNGNSPDYLKNNTVICLNSIKNDIHSARYFSEDLLYWLEQDLELFPVENKAEDEALKNRILEIRHYLIENGYYSLDKFTKLPVSFLKDEFVLDYYLKQMGVSKEANDEKGKTYYERVKEFIKSTLSTPLKVTDVRKVFQMVAKKKWEDYRGENNDYYTNIFNRICDSLEKNNNFISSLNELRFLIKVDDVLDERKYALFNAFIEYHQLYHNSKAENKMELLQEKKDDISKYAALFISKSKEDFISERLNELDSLYKQFFVIRIDNPIVKKKVVEIKQRDMLKKLFSSQDASLMEKLQSIKNKYMDYNYNVSVSKDKVPQLLNLFISKSINDNVSSIDEILSSSKPARFDEYETFEKVSKLINRLNSHNISYDGQEVSKYRQFITFNGETYIYNGNGFNDSEISQIMGYKDLKYVFNKVKSEIIQIAKGIDKFDNLTQEDIKSVISECPFTDEYYEFDAGHFNRYYIKLFDEYINSFEDKKSTLLNDNNYRAIFDLAIKSGLIQLSMITELGRHDNGNKLFDEIKRYVNDREICDTLANVPNLMSLMTSEEFSMDNLDKILDYKEMLKYADLKQISLLGKEVIKKVYSNNGFTSASQKERINVACDLLSTMVSRSESTVPYIKGSYGNYKYSMYDSTDETLLTAGLDTNACFRCCGNDNDFLHYCALDKNGFVIKITDTEGNFIGRASGFRNGNGVYINQLRTIYDKKSSAYSSEQDAIIKTFEQACDDIVETSQNNQSETDKIDFVVVTKSYTLSDRQSNVDGRTTDAIGYDPMDTQSDDWKQFVFTTKNLDEAKRGNNFNTDYGNYPIICIKSAVGVLTPDKIKKGDVPALYPRTRQQVNVNEPNEDLENYVNKIRACFSYQTGQEFGYLKVPQSYKVVTGDNWYIIFGSQGVLDGCYLPNDKYAKMEFDTFMGQLLPKQQDVSVDEQKAIPKR